MNTTHLLLGDVYEKRCWTSDYCPVDGYPECHVQYSFLVGNGKCDGGQYNTEKCGYDGNDCLYFNSNYPNCKAQMPKLIGDGYCLWDGEYNNFDCSWDGGDCQLLGLPAKPVWIILLVIGLLCSCRHACKSEEDDNEDNCGVDNQQTLPSAQTALPLPFAPVLEVEAPPGNRQTFVAANEVIISSCKENELVFPHRTMRQASDRDEEIQKFEIEGDT